MPKRSEEVCPGVVLTPEFHFRVNWPEVMRWCNWPDSPAARRVAWGLILSGLNAAGIGVKDVEDEWSTTIQQQAKMDLPKPE